MGGFQRSKSLRSILFGVLIVGSPLVLFIGSLGIGAYKTQPVEILSMIKELFLGGTSLPTPASQMSSALGQHVDNDTTLAAQIILQVRLPRLVAAVVVGSALSCSGAVFQGLFKNPLASPYTLGVSHGAGFGAAVGILWGASSIFIQVHALLWGLLAVGVTWLLACKGAHNRSSTLILTGVLVGSLFASLVSLIKFIADPTEKLPAITYWLMGSLSGVSLESLKAVIPFYGLAMAALFLLRWKINVLSLGDVQALSHGVNVKRDRTVIILCVSLLTALSVSLAGVIGWVGIVVPHIARLIVGPDYRQLLPVACSLGICYLIVIDNICRTLSPSEIPLGVVTGIVGAPLFAWVIATRKMGW